MIALLWATGAWADPVALRLPDAGPAATAGLHTLSVGTGLGESLEASVSAPTSAASVGLHVGRRYQLAQGPRGGWLQVGVSGGVVLPLVTPGIALAVSPWVATGRSGRVGALSIGLASPTVAGTGGLRWPLLVEGHAGLRIGPVDVALRLGVGPVVTPGLDTATFIEPALVVRARR